VPCDGQRAILRRRQAALRDQFGHQAQIELQQQPEARPVRTLLVVQGAKRMLVGDGIFAYNSERFLIASLDIPASSEVVEASLDKFRNWLIHTALR
jgi:AraC-type transcriptional regulator N-terminus